MPHSVASDLDPSSKPSLGFTDNPLYTALSHHKEKNRDAINNRYLNLVPVLFVWINFIGQQ